MELNRRNFVKMLIGGAAGLQFTPLPWKLTDDIAIWTQNWSWLPVPQAGEFTLEKSVCTLCPGGCGIEVRKVDGRAVKIEGRTDYPVNPGGICPIGMGGLQLLYNKSIRFTGPMKRVGPRGSGIFKDISWEEASRMLTARISDLRKNGKPESVAAIDGNPGRSTMAMMVERFIKAIGSPNYIRIPSIEDTYRMSNIIMQGTEGPMAYDLENSDYVLSFGCGLLEGWGAPGRVFNAWGNWHEKSQKKNIRIVQVESRASNTASKADRWVAPRPGTEAALALGLAGVIIEKRLYDDEFINYNTFGFHDWKTADGTNHTGFKTMVLKNYSPAQTAEITGITPDRIISLAMDFIKAGAPIAIYGKGKGTLNGSLYECMAVQTLNALAGNINMPGGVIIHDPLPLNPLPAIKADAVTRRGVNRPRIDQAGSKRYPFSNSLVNNLTEAILKDSESPVDTLLVFSSNPAFTLPDHGRFEKALKKVPFIVSFSPFRDETANMADLILPDHTCLEKTNDIVWPTGLQYPMYGLARPVVEPVYDTRNMGDVIIGLAKRIGETTGASFPWESFEEVVKTRVMGLYNSGGGIVDYDGSAPAWKQQKQRGIIDQGYASFNDMWRKIKSGGMWYRPVHTYKNREGLFKTPTGKFEFFSTQVETAVYEYSKQVSKNKALKAFGIKEKGDMAFMPHYNPESAGKKETAYPLLMVPYEIINLCSNWIPGPPFLNKTLFDNELRGNDSFAEINPATASEYGLKENDRVIIKSQVGEIKVRISLFDGAMPGIVYVPSGFGHTAYDEFLKGKGVNPNDIIQAGKDPLSGQPVWWNTQVQLIKV